VASDRRLMSLSARKTQLGVAVHFAIGCQARSLRTRRRRDRAEYASTRRCASGIAYLWTPSIGEQVRSAPAGHIATWNLT
jgi:hypothetical protein